jgi:hypothetical protein
MQRPTSLSGAAAVAILVPMLSAFAATAFAADDTHTAPAVAAVDQPPKPFAKFGEKFMKRGGGFGKQTIRRLKALGERVANHMIARPEDLGDLDEIAASVIEDAPEMLIDEARDIKHDVMSDAVRETVDTIESVGN